jgi:hypothetical protein
MKNPLLPFQGLNLHPGFHYQQRVFPRFKEEELLLLGLAGHELRQERSTVPDVTLPFDQGYGFAGPALPALNSRMNARGPTANDYDVHKISLISFGFRVSSLELTEKPETRNPKLETVIL